MTIWIRAAILMAGACVFSAAAEAKDRWLRADTGHFDVFTNARAKDAQRLVGRLEEFRAHFLALFPGTPFREPRVTVVIFDSDRSFRPYKPLYKGKPAEMAGVFLGMPDESVIALTLDRDLDETIPVIFHEYVHMLMHARGFRLPPWLNEGVAELYSTIRIEGDELKIGRHIPHHLMVLNSTRLMPLEQLFSVGLGSPDYNEGMRRSLFYAQSWALLHYWDCGLATEPGQIKRKGEFLHLLQLGVPADAAMERAFGKTLKKMEGELAAYVRGGRYYLRSTKVERVDYASRVRFEAVTDFERDVALANLKWRLQQNGDGPFRMLEFAEQNPEAARPYELLAAMAMIDGDGNRAVDYWKKAAARGSTNPYIYEQLARDSLRQYMWGVTLNFRLSDDASKELRDWLDRAIALAPNYAEAWEWRLLTEAFSKKIRAGVVNQGVARQPQMSGRPRYFAAIALVALRVKGGEKKAEEIAEMLLRRPDVASENVAGRVLAQLIGAASRAKASPWTQPPDRYPDVYYIANLVQQHLAQKPADGDEANERGFELPDTD